MSTDSPIVEDVRRRRMEISAEFDHDLHKYCEYLRKLQTKYTHRLVNQVTVIRASNTRTAAPPGQPESA
jgi:hypothetical protein